MYNFKYSCDNINKNARSTEYFGGYESGKRPD